MIIPFTYNLLKRHPALMHMIHRVADDDERSKGATCIFLPKFTMDVQSDSRLLDPFSMAEPVPALSGALDSSLWELYTHTQHYHSVVATLACIFSEAFTRPSYALEDFLDHTYGTVRLLRFSLRCYGLAMLTRPLSSLILRSKSASGRNLQWTQMHDRVIGRMLLPSCGLSDISLYMYAFMLEP